MKKPYKHHKKGTGRHVQLPEWLQSSEAWATMKPGPRALYIEIKRRYYGNNNGNINLSHRDAAKLLCVNRNTVGTWFKVLTERGFIRMTQAPYLGPSGIGKSSIWAIEEEMTADMKPARMTFMKWKNKTPAKKTSTPVPKIRTLAAGNDHPARNCPKKQDARAEL